MARLVQGDVKCVSAWWGLPGLPLVLGLSPYYLHLALECPDPQPQACLTVQGLLAMVNLPSDSGGLFAVFSICCSVSFLTSLLPIMLWSLDSES